MREINLKIIINTLIFMLITGFITTIILYIQIWKKNIKSKQLDYEVIKILMNFKAFVLYYKKSKKIKNFAIMNDIFMVLAFFSIPAYIFSIGVHSYYYNDVNSWFAIFGIFVCLQLIPGSFYLFIFLLTSILVYPIFYFVGRGTINKEFKRQKLLDDEMKKEEELRQYIKGMNLENDKVHHEVTKLLEFNKLILKQMKELKEFIE